MKTINNTFASKTKKKEKMSNKGINYEEAQRLYELCAQGIKEGNRL